MADPSLPDAKSAFPWLRIVLFTSLALNLLIAGFVAGAVLREGGKPTPPRANATLSDMGFGPFGRALSKDSREQLGRAIGQRAADLRSNRRAMQEKNQQLVEALRATPYQPQLVRDLLTQQQDQLLTRQNIGKTQLLLHIDAMTEAERNQYANRLARMFNRSAPNN